MRFSEFKKIMMVFSVLCTDVSPGFCAVDRHEPNADKILVDPNTAACARYLRERMNNTLTQNAHHLQRNLEAIETFDLEFLLSDDSGIYSSYEKAFYHSYLMPYCENENPHRSDAACFIQMVADTLFFDMHQQASPTTPDAPKYTISFPSQIIQKLLDVKDFTRFKNPETYGQAMIEHGLCVTATGEAAFPQTDPKQEELASAPVTEPSPADSEQVMTPRADIATSEGGPSTGLSQADGQMDSADLGVLDDSHSETSQMDPGPVDLGSETSRTLQ